MGCATNPSGSHEGKPGNPMSESRALKGSSLLAGLPPEDLRRDCPTARIVAIRHRGTIYRQGDPGRTVFCVLDGQVTIARVSVDGATLTRSEEHTSELQ